MDRIPFHPPGENNARLGQLDSDSPKSWSPRKLEEWKTKYNTLRYIMEGDKNPRPYDCGWCGAAQDNLRGLVVHVNAKHARLGDKEHWKKGHICEWKDCAQQKMYEEDLGLMVHLRLHTYERPYLCPHDGCSLQFSTRESNLSHQRPTHRSILRPIFIDVRTIGEPSPDELSSGLEEEVEEQEAVPDSASGSDEEGGQGGDEAEENESLMSDSSSESEPELRRSSRVPKPPPKEVYKPGAPGSASKSRSGSASKRRMVDLGYGPDERLDAVVTGSESETILSEGVIVGPRSRRAPAAAASRAAQEPAKRAQWRPPAAVRGRVRASSEAPSSAAESQPAPPRKRQKVEGQFEWQRTFQAPLSAPEKLRRVSRSFTAQRRKLQKYRAYLDRCRLELTSTSTRVAYLEAAHPDAEVFSKIKENGKNLSGTLDLLIERCDQAIAALENTVLVQLKELADEERKVRRSDNGSAAAAEEGEGSRREGSVADEESADGASVADSLETPDAGEYEEGTGSVAGGTEDLNGDVEDTENGSDLAVLSRMERRESIHPHPLSGLRRDNSGYDSADLGDEDSRMLPSDDEGGSELADEGLEEEIEESMDGSEAE